jgi:predicted nuclease of predicted toxin-antitoxin system
MKFHADEHVAEAVVLGLRRRRFDVTTTAEVKLRGASDEEQLAHCYGENRVIVTHDADMIRLAAAGSSHAGIVYCHNRKYKVGELLLKLLALTGRVSDEEMKGRVEFL